jgi:hypothetical protein
MVSLVALGIVHGVETPPIAMADDHKKTNNVCAKITDAMLIDLARVCAIEDRTQSEYLFGLIRRDLYGRSLRTQEVADRITS